MLVQPPRAAATLLDFFVAIPGLGPDGRALEPNALDAFTVPFGGAEQVFHIGPASVATPGMVPGVAEASRRLGALDLRDLVAPAAAIAREGAPLTAQAEYLHRILHEMLTFTPEAAAIFEPEGRPLRRGERIVNPDLAETLEWIGREGPEVLTRGSLGAAVVDHLREVGGLVTAEDLSAYEVIERAPVEIEFAGATVVTNAPPSTGGSLIATALAELDREGFHGDDAERLLALARASEVANRRRDELGHEALRRSDAPDRLGIGGLSDPRRRPTGTTHVSAVDAEGGSAGLSTSNGSGSGVVVPGTGFLLNNMLGEEDLNPDGFGAIPPGQRMSSMMAPTLVLRGDRPPLAIGSAGSNRLRSAITQSIAWIVGGGMSPGMAVGRPRLHVEGGRVDVEPGIPDSVVSALEGDGWAVRRWSEQNLFFGGVSVAGPTPAGLEAAGDPRRGGGAAGVTHDGRVVALG